MVLLNFIAAAASSFLFSILQSTSSALVDSFSPASSIAPLLLYGRYHVILVPSHGLLVHKELESHHRRAHRHRRISTNRKLLYSKVEILERYEAQNVVRIQMVRTVHTHT